MWRFGLAALAVLGACGVSRPDLNGVDEEVQALQARVVEYQEQAPQITLQEQCQQELERYRQDIEPRVLRLRSQSADIDGCMHAMAHHGDADMAALCADMQSELERHVGQACASAEPSSYRLEIESHCERMQQLAERSGVVAQSLRGMMGAGMMHGGCH